MGYLVKGACMGSGGAKVVAGEVLLADSGQKMVVEDVNSSSWMLPPIYFGSRERKGGEESFSSYFFF